MSGKPVILRRVTVPGGAVAGFGKYTVNFSRVLSLAALRHFGDLKLLASISHSKKKQSPVINIE